MHMIKTPNNFNLSFILGVLGFWILFGYFLDTFEIFFGYFLDTFWILLGYF